MVETVLQQLDEWYNQPDAQVGDRAQLLSKLALLELCGWIEGEFDLLVTRAEGGRLGEGWLEKNVVQKTTGFNYNSHLRRMLTAIYGELFAREFERQMEARYPGELERLKNLLAELWKRRCNFAHADFAANQAAQQVFDAPSWILGQFRTVRQLIQNFETAMGEVIVRL